MIETGNGSIDLVYIVLISFGVVLALSVALLFWVVLQVGRINVPDGTDFWTTLRQTPLSVVILLDLLDFGLDFLSAPVAWVLLNWLGLRSLRAMAAIEGFLPGTHLLPTMTTAWIFARLTKPK